MYSHNSCKTVLKRFERKKKDIRIRFSRFRGVNTRDTGFRALQ